MYTVDGKGDYITTGAGTMVAIPAKKGEEEEVVEEGVDAGEPLAHTHEYTWYQKVAGFTTHSFDSTFTTLTTKFVRKGAWPLLRPIGMRLLAGSRVGIVQDGNPKDHPLGFDKADSLLGV
eukprot:TRINITY_DN4869_c0_g1_i2.p2 TRINITY_DN4869_c0_g1~~TRINITY_DN4869_c0_g1_i2.p2  ORF type:complete len:120 (+),score=26.57 TRINITY_DN4869_c0_g1_i2:146-505(+)